MVGRGRVEHLGQPARSDPLSSIRSDPPPVSGRAVAKPPGSDAPSSSSSRMALRAFAPSSSIRAL